MTMKTTKKYRKSILGVLLIAMTMIASFVQAQTWQYLGAQYSISTAADLSVGYSGSTRTLYLAASSDATNGVLRSTGSSISWTKKPFAYPTFIICESANPSTLYAGRSGLLQKSTNSGDTWTTIHNSLTNTSVTRLAISPSPSTFLYVGAEAVFGNAQAQSAVLFYSSDAGSNWFQAPNFPTDVSVTRIIFDPTDAQKRYVSATGNSVSSGFFRYDAVNNTWSRKITDMGSDYTNISALAITPQSGSTNILYAGTNLNSGAHIYKTTNNGDSWTTSYTPTNGAIINDIKVDPFSSSIIYAATSKGVLKSTNSGSVWSSVNGTTLGDVDVRSVAIDPNTANLVYVGTAVKFYYSTNGGNNWIDGSTGADLVTSGGVAVYNDDVFSIAGTTTALLASKLISGSTSWQILSKNISPSFFAKDLVIDYSNPNRLYATGRSNLPTILQSSNGGQTWANGYQNATLGVEEFNAIAIDPNLSSSVYAVGHWDRGGSLISEIWFTTNSGATWDTPQPLNRYSADYYAVTYDKSSGSPGSPSQRLYAGGWQLLFTEGRFANPSILKSTDGGNSWQNIFYAGGITNRWISSFAIDPVNSSVVYAATGVGISGTGTIYKTTNEGTSWSALTTLPSTGALHWIYSLAHHPKHSNVLYMAEEANPGVWKISVTFDGGQTWSVLSTGLPTNVKISHLAFKSNLADAECPQYLYAATDNGVYKLNLNSTASASVYTTWNFVSVPLLACDMSKTSVWSGASTSAFNYVNGSYSAQSQLVNGSGYWVKFSPNQSVSYTGPSISKKTIDVTVGWNIIGGLSDPVAVEYISSTPSGIIETPFWGYDRIEQEYFNAPYVDPRKAYWVKVSQAGKLMLDVTATQANDPPPTQDLPPDPPTEPTNAPVLSGSSYLYNGSYRPQLSWTTVAGAVSYKLYHYACPNNGIDCNDYAHQVLAYQGSGTSCIDYGVIIGNKFSNSVVRYYVYAFDANGLSSNISNKVSYYENIVTKTRISKEIAELPQETKLMANYPNPFNPVTQIQYSLVENSHVTLVVYDVLGRAVETLVDGEQSAGYQSVEFDASRLPSGVYFYKFTAGSFSDIKKMLLSK